MRQGASAKYTTQPPTIGTVMSPEFLDHRGVTLMFGFSRATCYRLAEAGRIRTVNLREPGKLKGRRLFCVRSIRCLMEASIEQKNAIDALEISSVTKPTTPKN